MLKFLIFQIQQKEKCPAAYGGSRRANRAAGELNQNMRWGVTAGRRMAPAGWEAQNPQGCAAQGTAQREDLGVAGHIEQKRIGRETGLLRERTVSPKILKRLPQAPGQIEKPGRHGGQPYGDPCQKEPPAPHCPPAMEGL